MPFSFAFRGFRSRSDTPKCRTENRKPAGASLRKRKPVPASIRETPKALGRNHKSPWNVRVSAHEPRIQIPLFAAPLLVASSSNPPLHTLNTPSPTFSSAAFVSASLGTSSSAMPIISAMTDAVVVSRIVGACLADCSAIPRFMNLKKSMFSLRSYPLPCASPAPPIIVTLVVPTLTAHPVRNPYEFRLIGLAAFGGEPSVLRPKSLFCWTVRATPLIHFSTYPMLTLYPHCGHLRQSIRTPGPAGEIVTTGPPEKSGEPLNVWPMAIPGRIRCPQYLQLTPTPTPPGCPRRVAASPHRRASA